MKGITGENLLFLLERRLDNIIYRSGLAQTRRQARQIAMHGHVKVNGKKVKIPSATLKAGDTVEIKESSRKAKMIKESLENIEKRGIPKWLDVDKANFKVVLNSLPTRDEITIPVKEQLIVELYSK
jgi:small subunit ribosomal protein S4